MPGFLRPVLVLPLFEQLVRNGGFRVCQVGRKPIGCHDRTVGNC